MPTRKYRLQDGSVVPGTTTVIGQNLGWGKEALMRWAWGQGKEDIDYRETVKDAATAGTLAHAMAEADIKKVEFVVPALAEPEQLLKARSAFSAYLTWKEMTKLELLESEVPYVSEEHRFGGTLDGIARVGGKAALVDFKTSNGLYPDHILQTSAYLHLWEHNHPGNTLEGGVHILRFSKDRGHFHHHYYPREAMIEVFPTFVHLRQIHAAKKLIEGMT